jgi:hypothetical protein
MLLNTKTTLIIQLTSKDIKDFTQSQEIDIKDLLIDYKFDKTGNISGKVNKLVKKLVKDNELSIEGIEYINELYEVRNPLYDEHYKVKNTDLMRSSKYITTIWNNTISDSRILGHDEYTIRTKNDRLLTITKEGLLTWPGSCNIYEVPSSIVVGIRI